MTVQVRYYDDNLLSTLFKIINSIHKAQVDKFLSACPELVEGKANIRFKAVNFKFNIVTPKHVMPECICRASMTVLIYGGASILFPLKVNDDMDSRLLHSGMTLPYVLFSDEKYQKSPDEKA